MNNLESAIYQIRATRLYTLNMLKHIDDELWYRQPSEGVTHVAWQVGHLAVAQYGLALKALRGSSEDDEKLISTDFRNHFGKGSVPDFSQDSYSDPMGIRDIHRVHNQAIKELNDTSEQTLDEPIVGQPHPMFKTKLEALQWCVKHEFIHVGQIALLRRLFGEKPLR